MKKSKTAIWQKDWFLALLLTVLFVLFSRSAMLQSVERSAYDWGLRASEGTPSDRVAVIAIDNPSLKNIGRWPWSRDIHAQMIDVLAGAGAKVIGYTTFFFEPQADPGLTVLQEIGFFPDTRGFCCRANSGILAASMYL